MKGKTTEEKQTVMLAILDTLGKEEAQNAQVLIMKMLTDYVFCSQASSHAELKRVLSRRVANIQERRDSLNAEREATRTALTGQLVLAKSLLDLPMGQVFADPDPVE